MWQLSGTQYNNTSFSLSEDSAEWLNTWSPPSFHLPNNLCEVASLFACKIGWYINTVSVQWLLLLKSGCFFWKKQCLFTFESMSLPKEAHGFDIFINQVNYSQINEGYFMARRGPFGNQFLFFQFKIFFQIMNFIFFFE